MDTVFPKQTWEIKLLNENWGDMELSEEGSGKITTGGCPINAREGVVVMEWGENEGTRVCP